METTRTPLSVNSEWDGQYPRRAQASEGAETTSVPGTPMSYMRARGNAAVMTPGSEKSYPWNAFTSSSLFNYSLTPGTVVHESKRPAFRSARLREGDERLSDNLWTKTRAGKKANRTNYILFLAGVVLGIAGAAAFIVQGFLSMPKNKYCLVLEDHFDGPLDTNIWKREIETGGFGNHEFEWTTDSANNSFTSDGNLYIVPTLTADSLGDAAITDGYRLNLTESGTCTAVNKTDAYCAVMSNSTTGVVLPPVQSARLTTKGTKTIKYGRVEVRARMPTGDWLWPAIWMMPQDSVYGAWPASGEIDIVESKGNMPKARADNMANVVRSTLHWGPTIGQDHWWSTTGIAQVWRNYFNQEYHVFGLDWDETGIYAWTGTRAKKHFEKKFDRDTYAAANFPAYTSNGTAIVDPWAKSANPNIAPFDQEFFLILNVAVGGTNGYFDDADKATPNKPWSNSAVNPRADFWSAKSSWLPSWPQDVKKRGMAVDYVKMWQKC